MPELLETIQIETAAKPDASVIWMHGLGADGNDFVPVLDELNLADRAIRFIFPHAPIMPVSINNGQTMRAWYDVLSNDFASRSDEASLRSSQVLIEALIAREIERGIAAARIVIAGFSQGGAMTLQTGLRHSETLAGLMVLSSYVPLPEALPAEAHTANRKVPIFMAHGINDPVIPIAAAQHSRDLLQSLGYPVQWHQYSMPHSVCMEEIEDIGVWLREVLA
jgi:phospholipase/carboxylesterase